MSKYLSSIAVSIPKELIAPFKAVGINALISMYEFYLPKTETNGVGKIIIEFTLIKKDNLEFEQLLDILTIRVMISEGELSLDDERAFYAFKIHEACLFLSQKLNWKAENFEQSFNLMKAKRFIFYEYWSKSITHKNKKNQVKVYWEFEQTIKAFFVIVYLDKKNEEKIFFSELPPGLGVLDNILGKLTWFDDQHVRLYLLKSKDYWELNLTTKTFQFFFERAERGDAHGQYDLGMMYLNGQIVLQDKRLAIEWLKKSAAQKFGRSIQILNKINI